MTEIIIRNGQVANLSFDDALVAWDASRLQDITNAQNFALVNYSIWSDYSLSTTKYLESTYNNNDSNASVLVLHPPLSVNAYNNEEITHPYFDSESNTAIAYAGEDQIPYLTTGVIAMFASDTILADTSIFILSIGITEGTTAFAGGSRIPYPSMTYASIYYFFDFHNTHHYLVCRVGTKIKKVKVIDFEPNKPHVFAIEDTLLDGNINFYLNSTTIAQIPKISASVDSVWNSAYNYRDWDTMWIGGKRGFVEDSGTLSNQPFAIFAAFNCGNYVASEMTELALNRYNLCTTGHVASSTSITLDDSDIVVFDSATFSGLLIIL